MSYSAYELKDFYSRRAGRLVRRLISSHIHEFWQNPEDLNILGYGYTVPYLRTLKESSANVFALMPAGKGVHYWPESDKGLVSYAAEGELPFATESLDRILLIHGLEYADAPEILLREFWRVLKSNGRLLMIVPNRLGFWARADRTPFGHGTPYSFSQINEYLQKNMFIVERKQRALYMPPFRSFLVLRTAYIMESFGKFIFPGLAGVHLIEASKQIYSVSPKGKLERVKGRRILVGDALPT